MTQYRKYEVIVTLFVNSPTELTEQVLATRIHAALNPHPERGDGIMFYATIVDRIGPNHEGAHTTTERALKKADMLDRLGMRLTTQAEWDPDTIDDVSKILTEAKLADTCAGQFRYLG